MSISINSKTIVGSEHQLTQLDEKRKTVSIALKRVDQLIKTKEYQRALLEIAHVKEIDRSNVYAFALEERIKVLQVKDTNVEQEKVNSKVNQILSSMTKLDLSMQLQSQAMPSPDIPLNQHSLKTDTQVIQKPMQSNLPVPLINEHKRIEPIRWKPKVVIIDDDENLLKALSTTVESEGFEVFSLSTSDEAYMLLRKIIPDVILCDINLETSTMGGFTFFEKVREIEKMKHVPFMFLSGLTDDVLIRTGKEMGVDDYLTKPIKGQNLISAIRGRIKRFQELGISPTTPPQASITSLAFSRTPS